MPADPRPDHWTRLDRYRHYKPWHPRASFIGTGTKAQVAANFSTVSLFNNSNGANSIVVLTIDAVSQGITTGPLVCFNQGSYGSLLGTGLPSWAGETVREGQIFTQQSVNSLTASYKLIMYNGSAGFFFCSRPSNVPWAVLPPGWSIGVQSEAVNVGITASFEWEVLSPQELDYFYP